MTGASFTPALPIQIASHTPARLAHRVAWATSVALVAGFIFAVPPELLWIFTLVLLVCGFVLQLRDPVAALAVLPAPFLLGPITRIVLPGGVSLHAGDLYLATLLFAALLRDGTALRLPLGRIGTLVGAIAVLTLLSWMLSLDLIASAPTLVTLAELLLMYTLTVAHVRTERDVDRVLAGWLSAVTIASVLVIVSYVRRTPLLIGSGEGAAAHAQLMAAGVTTLWRATFFVTGFIYPLAGALFLAGTWVLTRSQSKGERWALLLALLVNLLALGLMGNATTIGASAIGFVLLAMWITQLPNGLSRVLVLSGGLLVTAAAVFFTMRAVMPTAQLAFLLGRASSFESLLERFGIWKRVTEYLLTSTKVLLVGLGPDISIRRGDHPLVRSLLYGRIAQQYAVDNGYLYLLLNYGFFVFTLVMATIITTLKSIRTVITRSGNESAVAIGVMLVVWMIMAMTQQPSVSKPAAMAVQTLALANILYVVLVGTGRKKPRLFENVNE